MPSVDRILTTHVGSLIRPPEVLALLDAVDRGEDVDEGARAAVLARAVTTLVQQQADAGVDVVSDGEVGKVNWISYLYERLGGLEVKDQKPGATFMPPSRDRQHFPEFYAEDDALLAAQIRRVAFIGEKGVRSRRGVTLTGPEVWTVTGPIAYEGQALLQGDIDRLKTAMAAANVSTGFLPVVAPASTYWLNNEYYKTDEALVFALADALHVEYAAIVDAGLLLQVDDAVLVHEYDSILSLGGSVADYRRWAQLRIDALKHALRGIPPERVRYHVCWGSWHGPHAFDPPLAEVVDLVLQVPARYYLMEQANPRHEHEWKLWETVRLPDDKVLVPGVVTHHTNVVEHPDLVAQRLTRLARVVGRERVMGGTDCGFAQGAFIRRVHPSIQWAKLRALADGAALATRELWGRRVRRGGRPQAARYGGGKMRQFALILVAVVLAPSLTFGQWIKYPTDGLPRNADGSFNRNAPTPRLADGHPDLSGVWHAADPNRCRGRGGPFINCGVEIGGSPLAGNLGRNLPGGSLPYKPEVAKMVAARHADDSRDDPHVRCLPDNPPRAWTLPHLTKALHSPKLLALLYEVNAMYRQIFIDGRPFPADMNPTWNGYSVGHWEGDTLVVETRGFRNDLWIDTWGSPMSDAGKMTERIRRPNFGTLEIDLTIDDPKNYTKPFTVQLQQMIEPDTDLVDEFCLEGENSYARMIRSRGK